MIFTYEEDGIHVVFPDFPICVTFGKDEKEAACMAREALVFHLYEMGEDVGEIPQPSYLLSLEEQDGLQSNEVFMLMKAFMLVFRESVQTVR